MSLAKSDEIAGLTAIEFKAILADKLKREIEGDKIEAIDMRSKRSLDDRSPFCRMPGTGFDPVISRCLRISAHWDNVPMSLAPSRLGHPGSA